MRSEVEAQYAERDSKAVEARRDLYLSFLKTFDLAWHLCHDSGLLVAAKVDGWWSSYQVEQQRMALLAAGPVAAAMDDLRPLISEFAGDLEAEIKLHPTETEAQEAGRREVWDKHAVAILTAQRSMESGMRKDLRTPE